jgi:hypothetical protein
VPDNSPQSTLLACGRSFLNHHSHKAQPTASRLGLAALPERARDLRLRCPRDPFRNDSLVAVLGDAM